MGTIDVVLLDKDKSNHLSSIKPVNRGYARYLISQKKALPKTQNNIDKLDAIRQQLQQTEAENLAQAETQAMQLDGLKIDIKARATEENRLYGSLGNKEIADAITKTGITINKKMVHLPSGALHQLGDYEILLKLHPKVTKKVTVHVVRSTSS